MQPSASRRSVSPPSGWLALAFFGVLGYLAAEVLQLDLTGAEQVTHFSAALLEGNLPLAAAGASAFAFAGLVGALWRANRSVGLVGTAHAGRGLGALGVTLLLLSGVGLPLALAKVPTNVPAYLADKGTIGTLAGTVLAFLGLALLCVGLVRSPEPSGRPAAQGDGVAMSRLPPASQAESVTELLEGL